MTHERVKSKTFWLGSIATLAFAVALGILAQAPEIPQGAGRMAPRVPSMPHFPELLFMLGVGSVTWYAVFIALPLLLVVARRIDTDRFSRREIIAASIATLLVLFLVTAWIDYEITYTGFGNKPGFLDYLPVTLRLELLPWIAVGGIVAVIEMRRRATESLLEREKLRGEVAEQRLIALTGQLQPHFLFNTLQGISTLIHRDPSSADEMLSRLSDLLRDLLRHRDSPLVKLEDEIRYIRTYLEISQFRFGERLTFSIDSPRDASSAAVPLFILQPLVENALGHGIGAKAEGGTISIRAARRAAMLIIEVEDDGRGVSGAEEGMGLSNTRQRLHASFGENAHLTLNQRDGGGTISRIEIPFTPA